MVANMSDVEKIRLARALLTEVAEGIDGEKSTCVCCGLTKYTNRASYQTREQLEAITTKLRRFEGSVVLTGEGEE
jgi:hypothetical protein